MPDGYDWTEWLARACEELAEERREAEELADALNTAYAVLRHVSPNEADRWALSDPVLREASEKVPFDGFVADACLTAARKLRPLLTRRPRACKVPAMPTINISDDAQELLDYDQQLADAIARLNRIPARIPGSPPGPPPAWRDEALRAVRSQRSAVRTAIGVELSA